MLRRCRPCALVRAVANPSPLLTSAVQNSKVTVLGAAGGIGQPLSLLLKLNPRVSELALYDIRGGPGTYLAPYSTFRKRAHR